MMLQKPLQSQGSNTIFISLTCLLGEEDLGDFRAIPIYPTHAEFHKDEKPFLRQNLTSQSYLSTHLYLDTHFRLMREDFVRPLRDGIQYLLMKAGGRNGLQRNTHFDNIRVYFDTRLLVPKCTRSGIAYIVQFDVKPFRVRIPIGFHRPGKITTY